MVLDIALLEISFLRWALLLRRPKSGPWRDIVDVLYDVSRDVVSLRRDVFVPFLVLPNVEVRDKQILNLFGRSIELNPLHNLI